LILTASLAAKSIMRTDIEELHAKLTMRPAMSARAVLGIIFSTAINHHLARVVA
jgi:hypothetical protein